MRLLLLFFTFSLFFNTSPTSADTPPSDTGIISKAKKLANQTIAYVKKAGNFLISTKGQLLIIGLYWLPYLIKKHTTDPLRKNQCSPIPLSELPQAVQNAVKDMKPTKDISFYKNTTGHLAYATGNNKIFLHEKHFFSCSPETQRPIIGHEITHIEKNHPQKRKFVWDGLTFSNILSATLSIINLDYNDLNPDYNPAKNAKKDSLKDKCILITKKAFNFIVKNPLIPFAIAMTLAYKFSQHQENEADMESAIKLNCTQESIDLFRKCIEMDKNYTSNAPWTSYLSPINIVDSISNFFGWTEHYSVSRRLENLISLAQQQKVTN